MFLFVWQNHLCSLQCECIFDWPSLELHHEKFDYQLEFCKGEESLGEG